MTFQARSISILAAFAVLLTPLGAGSQEEEAAQQPLFVRTIMVEEPSPTLSRQFFGRVAALDTIDLAFEVGGRLDILDAVEGRTIAAGALIAELDQGTFERTVERAELTLMQSERDLERASSLLDRDVGSAVDAQNAQTARDLAAVALRDARAALSDARLVAPFDALIADRIASEDTIITSGQPIVRLHDMSEVRVEFDLPERLVRDVGNPQTVLFDGMLTGDDRTISLIFREFRVETGPVGQSYTLSLAVAGESPPQLLPGQAIIVRASVPNPEVSSSVPPGAIATAPDGSTFVVAVEDDGDTLTARQIPVEVTSPTGSTLRIQGVPAGTEVVSVGAHAVPDGAILARYTGLSSGSE